MKHKGTMAVPRVTLRDMALASYKTRKIRRGALHHSILESDIFRVVLDSLPFDKSGENHAFEILDFLDLVYVHRRSVGKMAASPLLIEETPLNIATALLNKTKQDREKALEMITWMQARLGPSIQQQLQDLRFRIETDSNAIWQPEPLLVILTEDFREHGAGNWRGAIVSRLNKFIPPDLQFKGKRESRNTLIAELIRMTGDDEIRSTHVNNILKSRNLKS